ncbi:Lcl domain-containing protein [Parabacteroides sp.]
MNMRYIYRIGISLCVLLLEGTGLSAQIATTINGYPVIDLSAMEPFGGILSSSEAAARTALMNGKTASDSSFLDGANGTLSGEKGEWNAKMSSRFQVMRGNPSNSFGGWVTAYTICSNYVGEGGSKGQWRLPTESELDMIWILHPQLIGKGGFVPFVGTYLTSYWSSTEYSSGTGAGHVRVVRFGNGYNVNESKKNSNYTRCVRDL